MNSLMTPFTYKEAKILVNKNVLERGSEITFRMNKMIYDSCIGKIIDNGSSMLFKTFDNIMLKTEHILTIDGMDAHKLFEAYNEDNNAISIEDVTNVEKDVLNKINANINGMDLENGLKIIFHNDVNKKYNGKLFTVKGVGEKITLVSQRGRPKKLIA